MMAWASAPQLSATTSRSTTARNVIDQYDHRLSVVRSRSAIHAPTPTHCRSLSPEVYAIVTSSHSSDHERNGILFHRHVDVSTGSTPHPLCNRHGRTRSVVHSPSLRSFSSAGASPSSPCLRLRHPLPATPTSTPTSSSCSTTPTTSATTSASQRLGRSRRTRSSWTGGSGTESPPSPARSCPPSVSTRPTSSASTSPTTSVTSS